MLKWTNEMIVKGKEMKWKRQAIAPMTPLTVESNQKANIERLRSLVRLWWHRASCDRASKSLLCRVDSSVGNGWWWEVQGRVGCLFGWPQTRQRGRERESGDEPSISWRMTMDGHGTLVGSGLGSLADQWLGQRRCHGHYQPIRSSVTDSREIWVHIFRRYNVPIFVCRSYEKKEEKGIVSKQTLNYATW